MQKTELLNKLHKSEILEAVFPTLRHCLKKELKDCESVLDLGCGPSSPIQFVKNIKKSVGVEAFGPYLEESKRKKIHTEYMNKKIEDLEFYQDQFDAVIMIEVLEHMEEVAGLEAIKKAEKWAKKKIIVSTPNGFLPQKELDGNLMQRHLSGWDVGKMKKMCFKSKGLAGLRCLRQEVQDDTMGDDLTITMKYRPRLFWFLIAVISQLFVYSFPKCAFELFCVKNLTKKNI
jgi:SAM-dependent methyltransferase